MSDDAKSKVFLVDDHPLVREMLTLLIEQQPDLVVCGEAANVADAEHAIAALQPDVVLVDISLQGSSGLELIKSMRTSQPRMASIALSMHDERLYVDRVLRAGARGYIQKSETTKRIVSAIREVLEGRIYVSEDVAASFSGRLVDDNRAFAAAPVKKLSDRELEVFELLGKGIETRQVADRLAVSIKTVQAYCARIKVKLGLNNATELLREAVRWNEDRAANRNL